ncbi:hypothetical protein ACT4UT_34810, partial [Bacillus sp. B-TM1]
MDGGLPIYSDGENQLIKVGEDVMLFYFELVVILLCTKLAASMFFGIALVLIIYGGAELFTGNT